MRQPPERDLGRFDRSPYPRRNPGTVLARWWRELTLLGCLGALWAEFGWVGPVAVVAAGLFGCVSPAYRSHMRGELLGMVVLHRVRVGFARAGVVNRSGNLPLLVDARARGETVVVAVFRRYGTRVEDIARAAPVVAEACGALDAYLERDSPRPERVLLVVVRPRWGWPGR
ncbi:hypothetical protein ACL02T_25625 [Pseudonocardia sp. RS010]|uniref:hypothetical protein n=1 Tax=Pseudonocardia sp. RS010 TaxID=3385979 RepID=UPI0039A02CA4